MILNLIKRNKNTEQYQEICSEFQKCQQNKVQHIKKTRELYSLEISQEPWQKTSIDIIKPFTRSNNKDIIVIIMD